MAPEMIFPHEIEPRGEKRGFGVVELSAAAPSVPRMNDYNDLQDRHLELLLPNAHS